MAQEAKIEKYFVTQVEKAGGFVRKLKWIGRNGAPDRVVVHNSRVIWVELKKDENTEPAPHQLREHKRMREAGADVRVIGSLGQVDDFTLELMTL